MGRRHRREQRQSAAGRPLDAGNLDKLWIENDDLPELEQVIERLIEMQQAGAPLLIPGETLRLMVDHFREKKAPAERCRAASGWQFLHPRRRHRRAVQLYPAVGSLLEQSARDIWYGPQAQIRRQTVACDRLCLMTCLSQKTLKDKVKMGVRLLQGQRREGNRQGNRQAGTPNSASAA